MGEVNSLLENEVCVEAGWSIQKLSHLSSMKSGISITEANIEKSGEYPLEKIKSIAFEEKWLWAANDLSESASVTETTLATRILADLSLTVSFIEIGRKQNIGFQVEEDSAVYNLDFSYLSGMFNQMPGLISDKLKATLIFVWTVLSRKSPNTRGIIFAYDEAQNLADHSADKQYPLSLLLEVFQSLQKQNVPFLLLLTG
jgi:hypothetical protein